MKATRCGAFETTINYMVKQDDEKEGKVAKKVECNEVLKMMSASLPLLHRRSWGRASDGSEGSSLRQQADRACGSSSQGQTV